MNMYEQISSTLTFPPLCPPLLAIIDYYPKSAIDSQLPRLNHWRPHYFPMCDHSSGNTSLRADQTIQKHRFPAWYQPAMTMKHHYPMTEPLFTIIHLVSTIIKPLIMNQLFCLSEKKKLKNPIILIELFWTSITYDQSHPIELFNHYHP